MTQRIDFPQSVRESLGYYVYLLEDPTDGSTFYVGKGTGDRIFAHLRAEVDDESAKLGRIREIRAGGQAVRCRIARHGLTEKEAFEVESTLIDLLGLDQLTNLVHGVDARDRGIMTVDEVVGLYDAPRALITERAVLINIRKRYKRGMAESDLYEATKSAWKVAPFRHNAKYAFAVSFGIVRQVYLIERWFQPSESPDRWAFEGTIATDLAHHVGCSVVEYGAPGAQNPIKWINC